MSISALRHKAVCHNINSLLGRTYSVGNVLSHTDNFSFFLYAIDVDEIYFVLNSLTLDGLTLSCGEKESNRQTISFGRGRFAANGLTVYFNALKSKDANTLNATNALNRPTNTLVLNLNVTGHGNVKITKGRGREIQNGVANGNTILVLFHAFCLKINLGRFVTFSEYYMFRNIICFVLDNVSHSATNGYNSRSLTGFCFKIFSRVETFSFHL